MRKSRPKKLHSKQHKLAILAIALGLMMLVGLLIVSHHRRQAIRQQREAAAEQARARLLLKQTIADIQAKLPPPDSPDLLEHMPTDINIYIKDGFRYYQERDVYKYTFLQYQPVKNSNSDHSNEMKSLSEHNNTLNIVASHMPAILRERTIWLRSDGKRWHCYAAVDRSLQMNGCNDANIVANMEADEEAIAYRAKGEYGYIECGWHFRSGLEMIDIYDHREPYYRKPQAILVENRGAEKVLILLGTSDGSDYTEPFFLLLKNDSPRPTVWQIATRDNTILYDITLIGNGPASVEGLQRKISSIYNYEYALQNCQERFPTDPKYYRLKHWNALAERFIANLPPSSLHTYVTTPQRNTVRYGSGTVSLYPTASYWDSENKQFGFKFDESLFARGRFTCPEGDRWVSAGIITLCRQDNPTHPQ